MGFFSYEHKETWTTEDAFVLGGIADIICTSCIISNAITFYCWVYDGPYFVIRQVFLIGISALLLLLRDASVLLWQNQTDMYAAISGILEVLFITCNIATYWLFAFKYWTASFDIRKEAKYEALKRKAIKKNGTQNSIDDFLAT